MAEIRAVDHLVTLENGVQEVLWCGKNTVRGRGKLAPICFEAEAIGNSQDLRLSPNHCVYVSNPMAQLYFGTSAALVAVKSLVTGTTIKQLETLFPDFLKTTSKMTAAFLFLRAHEAYLFGASVQNAFSFRNL